MCVPTRTWPPLAASNLPYLGAFCYISLQEPVDVCSDLHMAPILVCILPH